MQMSNLNVGKKKGLVTLINPNLVLQKNDMLTTGIVYMPIGLSYFASALLKSGYDCKVIDAFGESPNQSRCEEAFFIRGLTSEEVIDRIDPSSSAIVLYAINLTYHRSLISIMKGIRQKYPKTPLIIQENTQAVTAYALSKIQDEFYREGAHFVLTGEAEHRGVELLDALHRGAALDEIERIDGIGFYDSGRVKYSSPSRKITDLDSLAFPAWDLFPLKNYWNLGYAHGPLSSKRYMPLLTSRGCPYACQFCVIPETNNLKWRARSAVNVVDEIEFYQSKWNVSEFHIEDVDPTVNDKRTKEICAEIKRRNLKIVWKICAGTKVETIKSEETLQLMAESGCRYISISPESGSSKVMKLINKPFNLEHAIRLIKKMNSVGIFSQACFVLGFPGEEDEDRVLTRQMAKRLTQVGLDEIALFIITPVPGSSIFNKFSGYSNYSQLNFSPTWRDDYAHLNQFRLKLYRDFLIWKLLFHPFKLLWQPFKFLFRRFDTKMEMTPFRAVHTYWITRKAVTQSS